MSRFKKIFFYIKFYSIIYFVLLLPIIIVIAYQGIPKEYLVDDSLGITDFIFGATVVSIMIWLFIFTISGFSTFLFKIIVAILLLVFTTKKEREEFEELLSYI